MARLDVADKLGLAKRAVAKLEKDSAAAGDEANALRARIKAAAEASEGQPHTEEQLGLMRQIQAATARQGRFDLLLADAIEERNQLQLEFNKAYRRD